MDDFRYANGPAYCISEALMMKVEKYLRYVADRFKSVRKLPGISEYIVI